MRDALLDVLLKRKEPRYGVVAGVVCAVALHVAVVPGAGALSVRPLGERASSAMALSLGGAPTPPQQRIEIQLQPAAATPAKPLPTPTPEPDPRGQVVTLPASKSERPLAADYLAESNQTTERETRARVTGLTPNKTRAPQVGSERVDAVDEASGTRTARVDVSNGGPVGDGASTAGKAEAWDSKDPGGGREQMAMEIPRIKETKSLDLEHSETGRLKDQKDQAGVEGNSNRLRVALGQMQPNDESGEGNGSGVGRAGGGGGDGPAGHFSIPTLQQVERLAGLPANDHLLVEEDEATSLNAFEWKHATYFNRVQDAVARVWSPNVATALRTADPDGRLYGSSDRMTRLEVTIDTSGNVVDLVLQEPSGAGALDDEALRSFRVAGPFPNPPIALFKGRDRYSFSFGFAVNYNRGGVDLNWRPY